MKPSNIKYIANQMNMPRLAGEQSMNSMVKYDDFMKSIVNKIKTCDSEVLTQTMTNLTRNGEIEQISGNFYKYKDFHILELFKKDGNEYTKKLKTLDKLNLGISQKYIETIEKDSSVFIITQIPGTEKRNLVPLWEKGLHNISKEEKIAAFQDLQKLTKAGFIDDKVAHSSSLWYVNENNKIIIPVFDNLRPITNGESQKDIVEKYYNILFK
jgi:hypothetical protein